MGESPSLVTLDLSINKIGDSGAAALDLALAASSALTHLKLSCEITALGAAHIAQGVRQGPLRRVPLTLEGVELGGPLGSMLAVRLGLGDAPGGWDTDKVLAALNDMCAAAGRSGAGAAQGGCTAGGEKDWLLAPLWRSSAGTHCKPAYVRIVVGGGVPRVSAANRRAHAALWGAVRVPASLSRRLKTLYFLRVRYQFVGLGFAVHMVPEACSLFIVSKAN